MAIYIKNLSFAFDKTSPQIFKNISFEIQQGKITFLTGPNGVGKSTLLKILSGNINPDEQITGSLEIKNKIIKLNNYNQEDFNNIFLVHQNINLMLADNFTARINIIASALPAYPGLSYFSDKLNLNVNEFINFDLDKPVALLSGGQKQMLAILAAINRKCDFLLLDEPTAALDTKNQDIVMQYIKNLSAKLNIAVLCICHDNNIIKKYSDGYYLELKDSSLVLKHSQ